MLFCPLKKNENQGPTPKNDFCRLFAKFGLLERLVESLASLSDERLRQLRRINGKFFY